MNQQQTPHAWDADDNKPVIPKIPGQRPAASSELAAAIRVAHKMLDRYGTVDSTDIFDYVQAHGGLTEALRILLRTVGSEPVAPQTGARCPAAHPEDPDPCDGPAVVTVVDRTNAGADGCAHHAARLLASIAGARVYALPDAPDGTATAVFKAADSIRPYPWVDGPRTRPGQLSRAENRRGGENA
ncbi:hypothetical protein TUSST3_76800 [Streptomyces sp. TUS-ST3]|uniref:hypothetical protein n=1 Tax=Streptomyces sp. TUS-ST3 TaxID=3025591 RepID=UPI00235B4837|nr:hypothetical protein [Streptomyces sp. TUS-ST3]GLP71060.1 hypothetical protein TUSST3_76800 [Streptomyces sp. TUS-ST3]